MNTITSKVLMMLKYISILFSLFLLSCEQNKINTQFLISNHSKKFPFLTKTNFNINPNFIEEDNPNGIRLSKYGLFYIGKDCDSLSLIDQYNFSRIHFIPPNSNQRNSKEIESNNKTQLDNYYIEWDKDVPFKYFADTLLDIQVNTKIKIKNSFPVLLRNLNKDTIAIGYGSHIKLILEAKDSLGTWKPIQKDFNYICGNGVGTIILPPNEIAITLAPIFKGKYKTLLRFTQGHSKSKPFWAYINYNQFIDNKDWK